MILAFGVISTVQAQTPEWRLAIQGADIHALQRLAPSVVDIDAATERGKTALMAAAAEGRSLCCNISLIWVRSPIAAITPAEPRSCMPPNTGTPKSRMS